MVGATTMDFGIILVLEQIYGNAIARLSLVHPEALLGLLMGGSVIYWFSGASIQAVVTGSYRAVVYIKNTSASTPRQPPSPTPRRSCASAPSTPSAAW
jgi:K(+)-stimulated pyrophosphate-energized sodium pump